MLYFQNNIIPEDIIENHPADFNQLVLKLNNLDQEFQQKLNQFQTEITEVKNENKKIQNQYKDLLSHNSALQTQIDHLSSQMTQLTQKAATIVHFTAFAPDDQSCNDGVIIQFPSVIDNIGGNYDESTSVFTCPLTGYYLFHVSILSGQGFLMRADITNGEDSLVALRAWDTDSTEFGSTQIVTLCTAGDEVAVRCMYGPNVLMGYSDRVSTFSGTLLSQVETENWMTYDDVIVVFFFDNKDLKNLITYVYGYCHCKKKKKNIKIGSEFLRNYLL